MPLERRDVMVETTATVFVERRTALMDRTPDRFQVAPEVIRRLLGTFEKVGIPPEVVAFLVELSPADQERLALGWDEVWEAKSPADKQRVMERLDKLESDVGSAFREMLRAQRRNVPPWPK